MSVQTLNPPAPAAAPAPAAEAAPATAQARRDPAPLPEVRGLPAEVADLCLRCLREDPAARPSSARLARRLARAVRLKIVVVEPPEPAQTAPIEAVSAETMPATPIAAQPAGASPADSQPGPQPAAAASPPASAAQPAAKADPASPADPESKAESGSTAESAVTAQPPSVAGSESTPSSVPASTSVPAASVPAASVPESANVLRLANKRLPAVDPAPRATTRARAATPGGAVDATTELARIPAQAGTAGEASTPTGAATGAPTAATATATAAAAVRSSASPPRDNDATQPMPRVDAVVPTLARDDTVALALVTASPESAARADVPGHVEDDRLRRAIGVGVLTLGVLILVATGAFYLTPDRDARARDVARTAPTIAADEAPSPPADIVEPAALATPSPSVTPSVSPSPKRGPSPPAAPSAAAPPPAASANPPREASPSRPPAGSPPCEVSMRVDQWPNGGNVTLSIKNLKTSTLNGWTLAFRMESDLKIRVTWNGSWTRSGDNITVRNTSHNGQLAPGQSASEIGATVEGRGNLRSQISDQFRLNGSPCQTV